MFDLIVTTFRHMEHEAASEIYALLKEIGDEQPEVIRTSVSGLLTVRTHLDPYIVIHEIRERVQEEPWNVRYLLRLIPIDVVVNTNIDEIKDAVAKLAPRILENETFRVTVEKRHSDILSADIIKNVAEVIDRKVSLDVQDWIVLVEVIGKETGISVVRPDFIFSSVKVKRESY
ncbi:MAG: THUMP domain-containing protein [Nitrososphaerales archaeon]